jgi:hypothetical protein
MLKGVGVAATAACRPGDVVGAGIHLTKHEIFFT